jgi:hypothetical protein
MKAIMYSQEAKTKFIELRARDWSLRRIAEELGVDKSTLVIWNKTSRTKLKTCDGHGYFPTDN